MSKYVRCARGFTLIELMIVVAIVAILAAVGYPSYAEHVARSRRAEARAVLLENAQWLERQYTVSSNYTRKGDGSSIDDDTLPVKTVPRDGGTAFYNITFSGTPTADTFTLQAVPTGGMSGDKCATFTLTEAGAKNLTGTHSLTVPQCWDR